jgi:surface protein
MNPKLILDACCYKYNIPSELVAIITVYYWKQIDNEQIKNAVYSYTNSEKRLKSFLELKYGKIEHWDTSKVTDMSSLFSYFMQFNDDISNWDTSNVTNMSHMFHMAHSFNCPLNKWNISNVTNMDRMFFDCREYNQPKLNWDISHVTHIDFQTRQLINENIVFFWLKNGKRYIRKNNCFPELLKRPYNYEY